MQRQGQDLGWFCSPRGTSRCLTSVDLPYWLCEHRAWGISRLTACIPLTEAGPKVVPTTVYFVSAHSVTGNTTKCTSWWTAPVEEYSVAPLPAEVLQYHLPHITAQKPIWRLLLQQLGSRPYPRKGCDNYRANRRPHSTSSAGYLLTTTPITPPIKRKKATTHWRKTWQASILKTVLAPKISDSHRLHKDAPT